MDTNKLKEGRCRSGHDCLLRVCWSLASPVLAKTDSRHVGDHRRQQDTAGEWTQRIWSRTNTLPHRRFFCFSPRARTRSAWYNTHEGGGLIRARTYAPRCALDTPHSHTRHVPRSTARAPDAAGSSALTRPLLRLLRQLTHPRTKTHAHTHPCPAWTTLGTDTRTHSPVPCTDYSWRTRTPVTTVLVTTSQHPRFYTGIGVVMDVTLIVSVVMEVQQVQVKIIFFQVRGVHGTSTHVDEAWAGRWID